MRKFYTEIHRDDPIQLTATLARGIFTVSFVGLLIDQFPTRTANELIMEVNEPKKEPDGKAYRVTPITNEKETNKYLCNLYNLLLNNKTIPADCGIRCTDGIINPTTDPQDANTLITNKMNPIRKRACVANMLHKRGCRV